MQAHGGIISVRDTIDYDGPVSGGKVGRLYLGSVFIDSVDIDFGVHTVGKDSLLFLPVSGGDITDHSLFDGVTCVKLSTIVPYFDSYFSSPVVEGRHLHYWGIRKPAKGPYPIYAMRFDFARPHLDSLPLDTTSLATDYQWYFSQPSIGRISVNYKSLLRTYIVDSAYTRVRRGTAFNR